MKRRIVALLLAGAVLVFARAAPAGAPNLGGFREAVITTADADAWVAFFKGVATWEVRHAGPVQDGLKRLWQLPDTAAGREILLGNPGTDSGFVRLVELDSVKQDYIRADDRPWDTGGHFDINVRVKGLRAIHNTMLARGWQGDSPPLEYTFGPFRVIEWIARGPDGVRLALIERLAPTLEGWPHLNVISRSFNSTQTVADMARARAFYEDVLGMKPYLEHTGASKSPGPNVLGLPHNLATDIPRDVVILHPDGTNEGSVELLAFQGADGADLAANAAPSNLGLSVLRFPVGDLDRFVATLADRNVALAAGPVEMPLPPYGTIRIIGITAPDGARLEMFQTRE